MFENRTQIQKNGSAYSANSLIEPTSAHGGQKSAYNL